MLLQPPSWSFPVSRDVDTRHWLEAVGLTLERGRRLELDGVTLRCACSEWLALVDDGGAASAALLAAIEGRCRVQRGELRWAGGVRPELASVLGSLDWPPTLRLSELLAALDLPATLPLLDSLGLQRVLTRPLGTLAPFEARTVQLAIADVRSARILLLDEPLQGLDAEDRQRMTVLLRSLRRRWPQALLRLGSGSPLLEACDRRIRLDRGRVCRDSGGGRSRIPVCPALPRSLALR